MENQEWDYSGEVPRRIEQPKIEAPTQGFKTPGGATITQQGIQDIGYKAATGIIGAPVDLVNMFLAPIGLDSKTPIMSSGWMNQQAAQAGIISNPEVGATDILASLAIPDPLDIVQFTKYATNVVPAMFVAAKSVDGNYPRGSFSDIATKKVMREIDDSGAKLNQDRIIEIFENRNITKPLIKEGDYKSYDLQDWLKHDELYRKYPELKDTPLIIENNPNSKLRGSYNGQYITVNIANKNGTPKDVMLHEIQHAIQSKEGWARGGSPDEFVKPKEFGSPVENINKIQEMWDARQIHKMYGDKWESEFKSIFGRELKDYEKSSIFLKEEDLSRIYKEWKYAENPHQAYQNLHGEQQARATQARMNYTPEQRASEDWTKTLEKTEGKYDNPIIKYNEGDELFTFNNGKEDITIPVNGKSLKEAIDAYYDEL